MLKIVADNSEDDIINYQLGFEEVKYRCSCCGNRTMIKIRNIDGETALCDRCKKSEGNFII